MNLLALRRAQSFARQFPAWAFLGIAFVAFSPASRVSAAPPSGYYDPATSLAGPALRSALHNVIKGQTVYPYSSSTTTDTVNALNYIEEDPANPDNVLLHYKGTSVAKSSFGTLWNREHAWPQSYGADNLPMQTDLNALMAEDYSLNSARQNSVYNYVPTPTNSGYGNRWTGTQFEVRDGQKGDVARAIFYMDVRYEGTDGEPNLTPSDTVAPAYGQMGVLSTLLAWNSLDPPDEAERRRNDRVYDMQHNRNPFIDHPEYVQLIYGTVHDADTVGVSASNLAPAALNANTTGVALLSLSLSTVANEWDLGSVSVSKLGSERNSAISALRLYRDMNANNAVDAADVLLTSTLGFVSNAATFYLDGGAARVTAGQPVQLLVAADINASAEDGASFGVRLNANGITHATSGGTDADPTFASASSNLARISNPCTGTVKIVAVSTRGSSNYASNAYAEYIVLANQTTASINLSGWQLRKVPTATPLNLSGTIPPKAHFLIASNAYATSDVEGAAADMRLASGSGIMGGLAEGTATALALFNGSTKVDGFSWGGTSTSDTATPPMRDGNGFTGKMTSSAQAAASIYHRKRPGGSEGFYIDTDDNASDLELLAPGTPKTPLTSASGVPVSLSSFGAE